MKYQQPVGGAADDPYVTGNPATDTEGSIPSGEAIEHPMREIINAITSAGLTPSAADLTQLGQAIATIVANAITSHASAGDPHSNYVNSVNVPTDAEAQAGTSTTVRAWSAYKVKLAVQALVQAATESVAGIAKVATQSQTGTGTDDATIVTPLKLISYLNSALIGRSQTWQDVTASRGLGVTYTNSSGRPILVTVWVSQTTNTGVSTLTVDGTPVSSFRFESNYAGSETIPMTAIVSNGGTYSVNNLGTLIGWSEFR